MADIVFVVNAYSWRYVTSRRHLTVTEEDVQDALDMIDESLNPFGANAIELRDYICGLGQLALRVELAGQTAVMRKLLRQVALVVAQGEPKVEIVWADEVEDSDEMVRVVFQQAFVR